MTVADKGILDEIVRRIVGAVRPEKIILFGSGARGNRDADSDWDILIVKQCEKRRQIVASVYLSLIGVGHAVDVVVATPEDLERYGSVQAMILEPALREGLVLYAA